MRAVPVRLMNPRTEAVTIAKGSKIATMEALPEQIDDMPVASVQEGPQGILEAKREILHDIVENVDGLNPQEREQLYAVLLEFADVFAEGPVDFGRTGKIKHEIDTGNSAPIRQHVRRVPPTRRDEVQTLLDEMLQKKVVQPSTSPWASPVVLIRKKDGSTRFCVDYRKVNNVTRKDAYLLPRIDDTLDTLAGSQWFTTLDLISGYWQVEMNEKDKEKTAFCTPCGLYEFNVMPFGLCNAPATFQRLMELVLAGLQWKSCLVYLDDVIIVGRTFSEHLCNLTEVLSRIREAGLKLKPAKCTFCSLQVDFLGHIVSRDGVHPDPGKVEKVANWPRPQTRKEVQQFLGLANYYRRFVQDFATIAKPLHRLTEKTARFEWTEECQASLDEIKSKLTSAPILAFPDFEKPFMLDTDASNTGLGGVLSQVQDDGRERVVAYASRVLTKPERRYCVTRRELLAVVTFTHHFRPYLLGRKFTIRTDHGSLTWLSNIKEPEGQLARWIEQLQEYHFTIVHRPGRKHGNADALSRRPCSQCGREDHYEQNVVASLRNQESSPAALEERTAQDVRQLQLNDPSIGIVLKAKEEDKKLNSDQARGKGPEAQRLMQLWERLLIKNGMLKRRYEDAQGCTSWIQLVVPQSLRMEIMQELHAGATEGHLGEEKTFNKIKERFYWPGMSQDVKDWCHTCATCATRKPATKKNRAPLETIEVGYPLQVVAVDILGPLPESEEGNSYVLVATDYFTKWVEAYAIPNQEAITVARKLTDEMFCRFSPPDQLHSDQGKQFESELLKEICKIFRIKKTRTTPYHPQCDGQVERFNRTLLHMLSTTIKEHPFDWEDQLPKVCMAYNTSVHSSTGFSPYFLMFGRQPKLPIDLAYPLDQSSPCSVKDYAESLKINLESAFQRAREQLNTHHEHRKEQYDKKVYGDPYKEGDLVWLHNPAVPKNSSRKLHHPWSGPYRITKRLTDNDYRIESTNRKKQLQVVHFNRLKHCSPGTRFLTGLKETPTEPDKEEVITTSYHCGENLDIVDDPSPPNSRYPTRERHPPERYGTLITI